MTSTCEFRFLTIMRPLLTSNLGGNSGSQSNAMTLEGSVNVGCGTYTFAIENPADDPPPTPESSYNGTSDSYYVSSTSIFANYPEFCTKVALGPARGGTVHTKTYNDQTPDKVNIAATFPGDDGMLYPQVSADDCNNAMKNFLDTCNVAGDTNTLNYKNGEKFKQTEEQR